MTDISSILAVRNAIIERNATLRQIAQGNVGAAGRGDLFATKLADASRAQLNATTALPSPTAMSEHQSPDSVSSTFTTLLGRVNAVQQTEDIASEAYERGETTDIATVALLQAKSEMAFEATMQIRNKLLSAYRDIMNLQI